MIKILFVLITIGACLSAAVLYGQAADEDHDSLYQSLNDLPWSERELGAISEIVTSDIYTRSAATEEAFKTLAPNYGIIHLSTHAILDDRDPLYSKFVFSHGRGGSEDGYLYTYELYDLILHANLVVLSACNTGTGKMVRGEGIMSLARGFMYAGCPSIILSLWAVDDKATSLIMANFYRNLLEGESKDAALRGAKLALLASKDPVLSNPYYWAGLVAIGNTNSLELHAPKPAYWPWILGSVGLLLLAGIQWKMKRRRQDSQATKALV
jgi:CHAT domain-containing protein